ncbi:50S ribosome-binding protein YggL [Pseudomonas aeruginosa]|nr:50S ribosome-binding protein YggL [Pseudomonas aeruginosa]
MKFLTPRADGKAGKRRLRKKLRLGEFQEFGWLRTDLRPQRPLHDDALDHLIDFVEARGWVFGGGGSPEQAEISGYLCLARVGSLDEADRKAPACGWKPNSGARPSRSAR